MKKRVLLFSTLNPYPFWAGSETFWFDFVRCRDAYEQFDFHITLADSPVTRSKGKALESLGITTKFYKHFNVDFLSRNIYKLGDRVRKRRRRTLPWFNEIDRLRPDLVWFCVSTLQELSDLDYAVDICKRASIPYWLLIQHSYEELFFDSCVEIERVADIAHSARTFIFIAERNRRTLELAIGQKLTNAFHSANTLPADKIDIARGLAAANPVDGLGTARFFSLGRFAPKDKGQHLLMEAFSQTQWKDRDWTLTFIGLNGFGKQYLERLAAYYGIPKERFNTKPFIENVFEEIVKHDVLLMPSLAEGTPYAMIESMACGRPVLGTPVGGIPELIRDTETGWLARTVDISDISNAMETMWFSREKWNEMGRGAQSFVASEYVGERSAEKLLQRMIEDTAGKADRE